jgi:hypothetical protein
MSFVEGADYFVRVVDLPPKVKALVAENDDGTYSIYLNAKNDKRKSLSSFLHEMEHIENNDFQNGKTIQQVEGL